MTFTFEGRPIAAEPGQSLAAALWADGVRSWRRARHTDEPRGLFCGIGVCFDCLITVNGRPNQRACLTEAHEGDVTEPQEGVGRAAIAR